MADAVASPFVAAVAAAVAVAVASCSKALARRSRIEASAPANFLEALIPAHDIVPSLLADPVPTTHTASMHGHVVYYGRTFSHEVTTMR